jgi:hypothetical protein
MAAGVSRSAPVIIRFSEAMDPDATTAQFFDITAPLTTLPASTTWNSTHIWMTNTPVAPFPAGKMIGWFVDGQNPDGDGLDGETGGFFTTASGGGSAGDCTNTVGSITLAKGAFFQQTSSGLPILDPANPYAFVACSALACSNWTTTNISLELPPGKGPVNLPVEPIPGHYNLTVPFNDLTSLEGSFPNGNYNFKLQAASGITALPMTLPGTLGFPLPAPHVTNYAAAQSINSSQPFLLGWDAAPTAVDCIYVEVYGVFQTKALGDTGALTGSARNVIIPANTLKSNMTYTGAITFYDLALATNGYVTLAYRATTTEFNLATSSGTSTSNPLVLTNAGVLGGKFVFEVTSSPGQTVTIETSTNLVGGLWKPLLSTNSPAGRVGITNLIVPNNRGLYYRAKTGS